MINGFIKGQSLKITAPVLVADSIKYLEAKFHFQTSDWDGYSKWAHFSKGDTIYDIRLNEDDGITKTDNLNLSAGEWAVYIHGTSAYGTRITTEKAFIEVKESGVLDGEPFPNVPLTAFEQLDNRVSDLEKGGTGSGGTGKNGATFTPSVSEDGVLSWTNDRGLPNPTPVNIKGKDGDPGTPGEPGAPGENGKSAFEYALEGGYTGSEEAFTEALGSLGDLEAALDGIIAIQENYIAQSPAPVNEEVFE